MPVPPTAMSRLASFAAALLVLVQLVRVVSGDHDSYVAALLLALVVATALASVKLYRDNCLESRLVVALLATISAAGVVLTVAIGLPGQPARPIDALDVSTLALSAAVLGLLVADQPRRAAGRRR